MRNRAEGTEITECGHDDVRPILRAEIADDGISRLSVERALQSFLETRKDYTEYPMLERQDHVTGYRNDPIVSKGGQGVPTPRADPDFDKLLEVVDDDDDWDLNGAVGKDPPSVSV